MNFNIEGNGIFGGFFKEFLVDSNMFTYKSNARVVILAVPEHAFEEVCKKHSGKVLVNVCSVQHHTNLICSKYSDRVVGIHPMFGLRTPVNKRSSVVTHSTGGKREREFYELYKNLSACSYMSAEAHDQTMAKTHKKVLSLLPILRDMVGDAKGIPDDMIPHSFRMLREVYTHLEDMSEGTKTSIESNPY